MYRFLFWFAYCLLQPFYWMKVRGREHVPAGAAIVCGNHTAIIDSVLIILALREKNQVAVMAKAELFHNKLFGGFLRYCGAFPVNRGKNDVSAVKHALKSLKDGKKLVIFPEGTRVKGDEAVAAKTGLGMFALRTGAPIVPTHVTPGRKAFHGCTVTFGEPFVATCEGKPGQEDYRRVSEEAMQRINRIGAQHKELTA